MQFIHHLTFLQLDQLAESVQTVIFHQVQLIEHAEDIVKNVPLV